jgi:transposase
MWTAENRAQYERKGQRYPSDVTDEEWALVEPHLPKARVGRRYPAADRRSVLDGILYVLTTGCQWRQLPKDFPSKTTVHRYFIEWQSDGTLTRLHHALYAQVRTLVGRNPTPTTAIVDSQSVKSAEKGGLASILQGTTRARKSRARSAMPPSIRKAC